MLNIYSKFLFVFNLNYLYIVQYINFLIIIFYLIISCRFRLLYKTEQTFLLSIKIHNENEYKI